MSGYGSGEDYLHEIDHLKSQLKLEKKKQIEMLNFIVSEFEFRSGEGYNASNLDLLKSIIGYVKEKYN